VDQRALHGLADRK